MKLSTKIFSTFALFSKQSHAGELTNSATIKGIANTNNNLPNMFVVYLNGGSGPCAGSSVSFHMAPLTGDADTKTSNKQQFSRTYTLALAAYTAGKKVYDPQLKQRSQNKGVQMRNFWCMVALLASGVSYGAAGDNTTTIFKLITKIDIQIQGTGSNTTSYYYFYPDGTTWGNGVECPNADRAFIRGSDAGAKEILSLALSAKAMGKKVQFRGTCGNTALGGTSQYGMYINYVTIE